MRRAGRSIVATHELDIVPLIADRAVVLSEQGGVVADGDPAAILADTELLVRANLIHEHLHRHGPISHSHRHDTADEGHYHAAEALDDPPAPSRRDAAIGCDCHGADRAQLAVTESHPEPPRSGNALSVADAPPGPNGHNEPAMENRSSAIESGQPFEGSVPGVIRMHSPPCPAADAGLPDSEAERAGRARLFDEVLAGVELVLVADGVAFWREEADHSLVLTSSRSIPRAVLDALDRNVITPLQSIMQRWPDSPLVAIPLDDVSNPIAEEIRSVAEREEIVGLAGIPCRIPGEMLGLLVVVHRRPHPWTVRDLGLATGFAGQLATAMQNRASTPR